MLLFCTRRRDDVISGVHNAAVSDPRFESETHHSLCQPLNVGDGIRKKSLIALITLFGIARLHPSLMANGLVPRRVHHSFRAAAKYRFSIVADLP
jgi:hypothetical protein